MLPQDRGDPGSGTGPARYPGSFLLAFREATAGLGWKIQRWLGDAVECLDAAGEEHTVGLENLFRRVRREERERWPGYITEFLGKVRAAEKDAIAQTSLDAVPERILVRLGQPFSSLPGDVKVWSQHLEGTPLDINLVIDQTETMCYVTEKMIADSSRSGKDWLEQALRNLQARTPEGCLQVLDEESNIRICHVGDAYDSSRALLLDSLLPAEDGCFVALPSRDDLLVLPVEKDCLQFIPLLKIICQKSFQRSPYPLTDETFWVHMGEWLPFPVEIRNNKVTLNPPIQFMPYLASLSSPEDTPEDEETE